MEANTNSQQSAHPEQTHQHSILSAKSSAADIILQVIEKYYAQNLYAKLVHTNYKSCTWQTKKEICICIFQSRHNMEHFLSEQFDHSFEKMEDYCEINNKAFCLFKPHGSWNWAWQFPIDRNLGNETALINYLTAWEEFSPDIL